MSFLKPVAPRAAAYEPELWYGFWRAIDSNYRHGPRNDVPPPAVKPRDKEAGGQLFAHFDGANVVIVEATPPTLLDRRSRYNFKPNRLLQRREIRKKYAAGLHFVGDWHTHPETTAAPSADDLMSMQDCFQRSRHDLTAFILVVVGVAPPPEGWYVALITADGVQRLSLIASDDRADTLSFQRLPVEQIALIGV